ncbi:MAG: VacB/RNase II family 3'-5' exoribonuclease [Polyangiales bacterium]
MTQSENTKPESLEQRILGLLRAHARSIHTGELRNLLMLDKEAHVDLSERLALMAEAGLVTELPGGKYRAPKNPPPPRTPQTALASSAAKPKRAAKPERAAREDEPEREARDDKPEREPRDGKPAREPRDGKPARDVVADKPAREARASRDARGRARSPEPPAAHGGKQRPGRGRGQPDMRIGRLSVNARGFGFVLTEETGPDVFIAPPALGSALHGDKVRVRVFPSPKGLDGQVLEVIERATHYIGGQLQVLPYLTYIEPDDERLKARVHVVGDLPEGAHSGQGVIAKVVGYPESPGDPLLASVIEAFEAAEFAEFEIRRILLSQGVREDFTEEVQAEARAFGDHVTDADREGRVDYRDLELLTIDPDDARDHDDAVYAERIDDGYRVIVAIADVSHYVKPGTELDNEALARGCTIYLPPRAIPMLPRELSSDLASLLPERDRLALAVDLELDNSGHVRKHVFTECVIRSAARLSYGGVARALGLTELPPRQPGADSRKPQLLVLQEVARLLGAQRKSRGSLDFDLPEAKVKLNPETGEPIDIVRTRTDPGVRVAYNMIEEMMLLANEVVARDLSERKVAAIYRVHGAPNEEKVQAFAELAGTFGFKIDEDIAEHPAKLARFLTSVTGTPHAEVLSYLVLRAMQQATYATDNIGHFGLAADDYVHFTSPIRRYPDLAVHRVVRKIARGEPLHGKKLKTELQEQAAESSRLERRAMLIEREVVDLYRAMLMRDRVGDEFEATITGITEHGIFAAIESPSVDVFCHMSSLPPDQYQTDQYGTRLFGLAGGKSYALFDRLTVRIDDVSIARRRISAVPIDVTAAPSPVQRGVGGGRPRSGSQRAKRDPRGQPVPRGERSGRGSRNTRGGGGGRGTQREPERGRSGAAGTGGGKQQPSKSKSRKQKNHTRR